MRYACPHNALCAYTYRVIHQTCTFSFFFNNAVIVRILIFKFSNIREDHIFKSLRFLVPFKKCPMEIQASVFQITPLLLSILNFTILTSILHWFYIFIKPFFLGQFTLVLAFSILENYLLYIFIRFINVFKKISTKKFPVKGEFCLKIKICIFNQISFLK